MCAAPGHALRQLLAEQHLVLGRSGFHAGLAERRDDDVAALDGGQLQQAQRFTTF